MSDANQTETLRAAVDLAHETAKARPTQKHIRALKKAQRELDAHLASLTAPEDLLPNIPALVEYLDGAGYKIAISTAYEHREQGKLQLRADGTLTIPMALEYAAAHLQKRDGSKDGVGTRTQRDLEEIRRVRADADMRELKYRQALGEVIPRSQVEIELAERAENLKMYFDSVSRSSAGRIIKLVGGDPQRGADLVKFQLGVNRKAFDNYARPITGLEEEED